MKTEVADGVSSGAGANNGSLKLSIDGQLKQTLSGNDNDTRQVDYIRLGAVAGIDSNTRGTLYLDDFRSWDPTAAVQAEFRYDGDGRRVQSVVNGATTAFVGQYFEWTGSTSTMMKYYYFSAQRVAVRDGNGTGTTGLSWLLTDHLGSTTISLDASGLESGEKRYKPWGEERFTFGTLPTQYTYTGQYSHTAQFGLLFYNARWFDPLLGRFAQADTIIPGTGFSIAWDRYAGMLNNPVKYVDPSGNKPCIDIDEKGQCIVDTDWRPNCNKTIYVDGKKCERVSTIIHVTWYYTPIESEFNSGQKVEVIVKEGSWDKKGKSMMLDREAVNGDAGMRVQGSLKIGGNDYINSLTQIDENTFQAYSGFGRSGLRPYYDGAVGGYDFGNYLFISDFSPYEPNFGIFYGRDKGGGIEFGDLDIYMGEGNQAKNNAMKKFGPLNIKGSGVFGNVGTSNFNGERWVCNEK